MSHPTTPTCHHHPAATFASPVPRPHVSHPCAAGPAGGLTPTWNTTVGKLLDDAMPFIRNGTIVGLFLGDEPCCMGVSVSALDTVARFCKDKIAGTKAFVYVNEVGTRIQRLSLWFARKGVPTPRLSAPVSQAPDSCRRCGSAGGRSTRGWPTPAASAPPTA